MLHSTFGRYTNYFAKIVVFEAGSRYRRRAILRFIVKNSPRYGVFHTRVNHLDIKSIARVIWHNYANHRWSFACIWCPIKIWRAKYMLHDHRICELCYALVDPVYIFNCTSEVVETHKNYSRQIGGFVWNIDARIIWAVGGLGCGRRLLDWVCTSLDGSFTTWMCIRNLSDPLEGALKLIGDTARQTKTVSIADGHVAFLGYSIVRVRVCELLIIVWKILEIPGHDASACAWRVESEREDFVALDGVYWTNVVRIDEVWLSKNISHYKMKHHKDGPE